MVSSPKSKVIQVQRPAQSLQAFQTKVNQGADDRSDLLKPMLITAGAVLVVAVGFFGFRAWRAGKVEAHEAALAALQVEVNGPVSAPAPAAEVEKRMRERLPQLEALARNAPGSEREATERLVGLWKLQLEGQGTVQAQLRDPWGRLQAAQKALALGQAGEALGVLAPLRKAAGPDADWGTLYWTTLLDADRLAQDRAQGLKDLAEYKDRFKTQADPALDAKLNGI